MQGRIALLFAVSLAIATLGADAQTKKARPKTLKPGDEVVIKIHGDESDKNALVKKTGLVSDNSITILDVRVWIERDPVKSSILTKRYNAVIQAVKVGDKAVIEEAARDGWATEVTDGTKVLVLERASGPVSEPFAKTWFGIPSPTNVCKVRVLEGKNKDRLGWLPVRNLAQATAEN
jgi:hypothetical protein